MSGKTQLVMNLLQQAKTQFSSAPKRVCNRLMLAHMSDILFWVM